MAVAAAVTTAATVEAAAEWCHQLATTAGAAISGVGLDTLTAWSTGPGGWRPADLWLSEKYPAARRSGMAPNGLRGSMPLGGGAFLLRLRALGHSPSVSETHPKVLAYALAGIRYDYAGKRSRLDAKLQAWLALPNVPATRNDHEWDALASAFAVAQGLLGRWSLDLHALPSGNGSTIVWPFGRTRYYWPSKPT